MPRSAIMATKSVAEFVGAVPANIQNHDFLVKVTTLERLFHRYKSLHPLHHAEPDRDLHQNRTVLGSFG
jgi:hypothetical protein